MKLSFINQYIILLAVCGFLFDLPFAYSQGFTSITPLDPIPMDVGFGTEDKSQSKVFIHDGKHWAVIANPSNGTGLYRLDGTTWTFITNVSGSKGRADCKIIGDIAHIFLFRGATSYLVSMQYDASSQTFEPWNSRQGQVGFFFDNKVQTATIDIDGTGKMWIAYVRRHNPAVNGDVMVRWSIPPYSTWSEEIILGSSREDDIATLTALPGKIGVMWSDQTSRRFGFRTHLDENPPDVWTSNEVPASQSALEIGGGMADDHINLAASSTGVLYAAVKHGYNDDSQPLISLLVRQPSGIWDNSYTVSNTGTTPIALLNEAQGKIKVVYSSKSFDAEILYRESSTTNISFGSAQTLIGGGDLYRDPTGLKSTYNPDVVVLASHQDGGEAVGVLGSDAPAPAAPPAPSLISPAPSAQNVPVNTIFNWNTAEGASKYWLQVSTLANFSSTVINEDNLNMPTFQVSALANETEYFWRVQARNVSGTSAWSEIRSFTTEEEPPALPGRPIKMSPPNNSTEVAINPVLEWYPVSDANTYEVQVATANDANAVFYDSAGITGTSLQLPNVLSNGQDYWWTVRAINNRGAGEWSSSWKFTTTAAPTTAPGAPTLISPSNEANDLPLSLSLEWGEVPEADNYSLQVSKSTDFNIDLLVSNQSDLSTSTQLSGLENNMTYYWRVQGHNEVGEGTWSQVWSFTTEEAPVQIPDIPELLSPAHQATGVMLNPQLEWAVDEDADYYGLQVSLNSDFIDPFIVETHYTQASYSLSNLAFGTQYFWRVRAKNSAGDSEWTEVSTFTTVSEAALLAAHFKMDEGSGSTLTDASPNANHAGTLGSPVWVPGVKDLGMAFNGTTQYAEAPHHAALDANGAITIAAWIRPEKSGTQFLVKKASFNSTDGYELSIGSKNNFYFRFNQASSGNTYLLPSQASFPNDGSTWVHVAVTYDGNTARIYINGQPDAERTFSSPPPINTNGLPLTIGADESGLYKFKGTMDDVRIYSLPLTAEAIQGLAELEPAPAPLLSSPDDNSTGISTSPTLNWQPSEGAGAYRLQVSLSNDFSSTLTDTAGFSGTEYPLSGLAFGTQYFWRVLASNPAGDSQWSETRDFTTISESATLDAHFLMDEGSGTTLLDASPNANHAGTTGGPTWVPGIKSMALSLNGTSQYAEAPDHASLDITGSVTIAAWIRPEKSGTQFLVKKASFNSTDGYELSIGSKNNFYFRFNQASSGNTYLLPSQASFPNDGSTWVHVAVTYDGNTARIYINGQPDAERTFSSPPPINTNGLPLTIGADESGLYKFKGTMDDVRIYSLPLTAEAIQGLAELEPAPAPLLSSPDDNSTGISTSPTLNWQPSEGAGAYRLQVSLSNDFSSTLTDTAGFSGTEYPLSGLAFGTQYFWRVLASNPAGDSQWSETRDFTTISESATLDAHFLMDEGSGTTLLDASPNANHAGTTGGPTWVPGIKSMALSLNGTSQYAEAPDHASLDITGSVTIAAWIRPEKSGTQFLVKKASFNSTDGYELSIGSKNNFYFRFNQASSGNTYLLPSQASFPNDGSTWVHVAVTYDGNTARIYINGQPDAERTFSSPPPINTNGLPLTIGADESGLYKFKGTMDDVRIYSLPLTAEAIQGLAELEPAPAPLLSSPDDNSTGISTSPTLNWQPSEGAGAYRLQVSLSNDFSSTLTDTAGFSGTEYPLSGLAFGTQYFWRVLASNPAGDSQWSETRDFTTISESATLDAHFLMDEGSGTTLLDASPNANHAGTTGGPTWVPGIKSMALSLNGTSQYAEAPDHASLDITGSVTIAAWIRPEKSGTQFLVKKASFNSTDGYELSIGSKNNFYFRFNQASSGNTYLLPSQASFPNDGSTWVHVAVTYDGNTARIYINGQPDAERTFSSPPPINTNGLPLTIGADESGLYKFKGTMDDVRIYSLPLTAEAIQGLAELEPAPAPLLSSPDDNSTGISTSPTLNWQPSEGAGAYRLQVSLSNDFSSTLTDTAGFSGTEYPLSGLAFGTQYFWRVLASNPAGDSQWSETRDFTTISESATLDAHFLMDEGSGTTLLDASPNANHAGTTGGPTWVPGIKSMALSLNGTSQYAEAPDHASLDITGSVTIAAWIRPEKSGTQFLVKKASFNSTDGYELSIGSKNNFYFRFNQASSGNTYLLPSQASFPNDGSTWVHVAVTYDGNTARIYINGQPDAERTFSSPPPINTNGLPLTIGADESGLYKFKGTMDDVRIYSLPLTAEAIQGLAELEPAPAPLLSSPDDNSTGISTSPTLNWQPSEGAGAYRLQVSLSNDFSSTLTDTAGFSGTEYPLSGLAFGTQYFWRVLASNPAGDSQWSETRDFTTISESATLDAHFLMDEGSGTTLLDASPNANHAGTTGGPTWVPGIKSMALSLNGTSQYAEAPDHASLDITGSVTIAAWIRPEKSGTQFLVKKASFNSTDGYELSIGSKNNFYFRFNQASSGNTYLLPSQASFPNDGSTWVHVAVTYDGNTARIYINGQPDAERTFSSPPPINTNGLPLTIGADESGLYKFKGTMDDVRIYSLPLTAEAIQGLAELPSEGSPNARLSSPDNAQLTTEEQSENALSNPYTLNKNLEINMYPNPVDDEIHLEFVGERPEIVDILIYDQLGRIYLQKEAALETANLEINQMGQRLKPGVYFLRVQASGISKNFKFLKK